jgi:hypothetical protein
MPKAIENPNVNNDVLMGDADAIIEDARHFSSLLGHSQEKTDAILKEMQSSDFENLLMVFEQNYSDFVDIVG